MLIDRIKEKIERREPVVGTHVKWSDSNICELFALAGYDFIWMDGEHGSMTIESVQNHVRAAQMHGCAAFYRVPWNDPVLVKPILELGVDGIVFPFICSAQEAARAVAACRYPPAGVRGYGPGRADHYGMMPGGEYMRRAAGVWKIMQIEHISAVENLDEILAVPGVDAIVVGMCDLSGSLGCLTEIKSPAVVEQLDVIAERCLKAGMPFGTSMGVDYPVVDDWFRRGASWISIGGDHHYLREGALNTLRETRALYRTRRGGGQ